MFGWYSDIKVSYDSIPIIGYLLPVNLYNGDDVIQYNVVKI